MVHPTTPLLPPPSPQPPPSTSVPTLAVPVSMVASPSPCSPSHSFASATALHLRTCPCYAHKHGHRPLHRRLSPLQASVHPFFPSLLPSTIAAQLGLARWLPLLPSFSIPKKPPIKISGNFLILSLLPPTPLLDIDWDLVPVAASRGIPVDQNLLQKLQQPKIIVPQPPGRRARASPLGLSSSTPALLDRCLQRNQRRWRRRWSPICSWRSSSTLETGFGRPILLRR